MSVLKEIVENQILSEAVDWLDALHEAGILDEEDLTEILENEELTVKEIKEFVENMNTLYSEEE
jgi:hypothetical protein